MTSRIAIRLPLHLQRRGTASASLSVASSSRSVRPMSSVASSSSPSSFVPSDDGRSRRKAGSRSTFTLANNHACTRHRDSMGVVGRDNGSSETTLPSSAQQPVAEFHTSHLASFHTQDHPDHRSHHPADQQVEQQPGSVAFGECEISALSDLFLQFANSKDDPEVGPYLNLRRIRLLLESVGEKPDDATLKSLMDEIDTYKDGKLRLDCFLRAADKLLGKSPASIVLVVGGPGSGKGALCARLARDCGAIHLSCGEMLREEVEAGTPLGREVADIMARGDLVSSALVTALMRRRMRRHPGRRVLLDGFPRSLENARDFVELCGPPELALHLDCDDTILIERILARGGKSAREAERAAAQGKGRGEVVNGDDVGGSGGSVRSDDNVHTAIQRLKNYHKHHPTTMSWLKEIRVPIVELDCSGSKDDVWRQLEAIGRLMRPAVQLPQQASNNVMGAHRQVQQQQQQRSLVNGINGVARDNDDMQWIA